LVILPNSMTQHDAYKHKAQIIKAMGHPSRLMMIDALAEGEKCVCELQQIVGSDMSTVSKHLSVLRNAGLVDDRKQGLQVFYSLRVPCIMNFFGCVEAVMAQGRETMASSLSA
jgi:DNA-binding transcriptional ArsR family regulator